MPNKLSQLWQELKRRRVIHVIVVYATVAYVIIELVNNVTDPLSLPDWTPTFVIVLLSVGLPFAIIFSWIFDITPNGIEKTKPMKDLLKGEKTTVSSSWRIATYVSVVIIIGLLVYNIFGGRNETRIDETLEKSIAVLPFANMSGEKEQDYFCDGITEDILNDLTHLEGIRVVARTSSFSFKDKDLDIREIGKKLGVHSIVEGSVRKAGKQLRITVQLINVDNGFHLWSERYDRELEDVFAIQKEIAQNIVQALEIKLSKKEKYELEKIETYNVQAYDYYVKGRSYFHHRHYSSTRYAIDLFTHAIQIDEHYALAYAGLADSYSQLYMYYDRNEENLEHALEASQNALKLDPGLAEAHSSRGLVLTQNKQYKEAEEEFETAIQLNPKLFVGYYQYARACRAQGNYEQAARLFEKATQVRPEDYEAALFLVSAYDDLNLEIEMENEIKRALEVVRKHLNLNPDDARALYLGAGALIKAGEPEEALQMVEKAVLIDPNETAVLYNASCIYSLLGKIDMALDYFEKAIESGYSSREWIENDSDLDPIRDNPRFQKIMKKLN
jgi:adenylate cyclase